MAHNADAKKPSQKKKEVNVCDCGGTLRWVKSGNNNNFYFMCEKCQQMTTRHGKIYIPGKRS
jgi:hypothetical protein